MTTDDIFIDFETARNLLSEVVSEGGDAFVYKPTSKDYCTYWNSKTGKPDCGVGRALAKAGVPGEILQRWDENATGVADIRSLYAQGTCARDGVHITNDAMQYFAIFQRNQDAACEWGEAQHKAELWARRVGLVTE